MSENVSMDQETLKKIMKESVEAALEEKCIYNLKERLESLISTIQIRLDSFEKRLDLLERRLDLFELSFYTVKNRRIRKIREIAYSSYEGINTRKWIKGVGG